MHEITEYAADVIEHGESPPTFPVSADLNVMPSLGVRSGAITSSHT